jgi:hypothetical protein
MRIGRFGLRVNVEDRIGSPISSASLRSWIRIGRVGLTRAGLTKDAVDNAGSIQRTIGDPGLSWLSGRIGLSERVGLGLKEC